SSLVTRLRLGTLPVVLLALIVLTYFGLAQLLKPPPRPDATWTRIVNEGVFRIGIDPSFPPFEADDGKGNLSGLDIALADELARRWSIENITTTIRTEYVYTGFDGLYDALKAGQFDAILSALPYDPKRTQDVLYSHSYFNGGPLVVVRESDATTKSYSDLANRRVGVELGSSGDAFARKWQRRLKYDLSEFNTPEEALRSLRAGAIDGVFTDAITFGDFARSSTSAGETGLKTVGDPLSNDLYVIAVRRTTPTLWQQINAVIDAMKRDGRMEQLQKEWF
ncbi:MAG: amino acid ABC transporter substrate-binding protein, partial [Chloroflexota bacterium]|nr:amino acid ABC transporter substrate-binding protein [Chloroflexota bacterium]